MLNTINLSVGSAAITIGIAIFGLLWSWAKIKRKPVLSKYVVLSLAFIAYGLVVFFM